MPSDDEFVADYEVDPADVALDEPGFDRRFAEARAKRGRAESQATIVRKLHAERRIDASVFEAAFSDDTTSAIHVDNLGSFEQSAFVSAGVKV